MDVLKPYLCFAFPQLACRRTTMPLSGVSLIRTWMLRVLPKFLLVATAFAPVMLTSAVVSFSKGEISAGAWLVVATVVAVTTCVAVMSSAAKKLPRNRVTIKSIKPADKEIIGFVLAYLLPLARGSQFETLPLIAALVIFFLVVMTSNAYHTNPLLGLLEYHFYEVIIDDVGYVLISRKNLHSIRRVNEVVSLTDYMLLDVSSR